MAKEHELIAFSLLKKRIDRNSIKQTLKESFPNVSENVLNIAITRAAKALVEKHPEYAK